MNAKKTLVSAAIATAMGVAITAVPTVASAVAVIDGQYELTINVTPTGTRSTAYGGTESFFKVGTQARGWQTSFTFGTPPGGASQGAGNNGTNVTVANDWSGFYPGNGPGSYGTADAAQTDFGRMVFDVVSGGVQNSQQFQIDSFFATAGGTFGQFINGGLGTGTFTGSFNTGATSTFGIANRFGAIDGPTGGVIGPWNIEPAQSAFVGFSTNGAELNDPGTGQITGTDCTGAAGSYSCVMVSYGAVGSAWGTFTGNPYYEVWNLGLTRIGDAAGSPPEVPLPAAVWLFGSGLLGMVGVARRKKRS